MRNKKLIAIMVVAVLVLAMNLFGSAIIKLTTAQQSPDIQQLDVTGVFDQYLKGTDYSDVKIFGNDDDVPTIITLKGESLLDVAISKGMTLPEYLLTEQGKEHEKQLLEGQKKAISEFMSNNIDFTIKYSYTSILNGFGATVKYGDLSKIANMADVVSANVSEFYYAPTAVAEENTVNATIAATKKAEDYTGSGMLISVIDTGIQVNHEAFSIMPENTKIDKDYINGLLGSFAANNGIVVGTGSNQASTTYSRDLTADDLYINDKLPFGYDYVDEDTIADVSEYEVNTLGLTHGTHVAGIAAGNNGKDFFGVAPDAQIAVMKVFGLNGGAYTIDVLAAISDSILLGADVVNMSLGRGAGFSDGGDENVIFEAAHNAGVILSVAAGNDYQMGILGNYNNQSLAENIDFGVVSSTSTYLYSFSVASLNAIKSTEPCIGLKNGATFEFNNIENKDFVKDILNDEERKEIEYVMVPGTGSNDDYNGIDVNGKIAVVERGTISFEDKFNIAQSKGAIGCIVYDNIDENYINMVINGEVIPGCFVKQSTGKLLKESTEKVLIFDKALVNDYGYEMSGFSSWGPTPDLKIKPEITGYGGMIYSAIPFDSYEYMSGTSMAAPNVAGIIALAKQYVAENFSDKTPTEQAVLIKTLLMNTADIVMQNRVGTPYSPRKQGAGNASLENLLNTNAYLTVEGSILPKIELGHDPEKTGVYSLKFKVTNFGDEDVSYTINPMVMCEALGYKTSDGKDTVGLKEYMLSPEFEYVGIEGNIVTVKAGEAVSVEINVTLSEEDRLYLDKFPNGNYVDGYIVLNNDKYSKLSIPFLAFYGDWTAAPLFDYSIYDDENQYAIYGASILSYDGMTLRPLGQYAFETEPGVVVDNLDINKLSFSTTNRKLGNIYALIPSALRNVGHMKMVMEDADTGMVFASYDGVNTFRKLYAANAQSLNLSPLVYNFTGVDVIPFGLLPSNTRIRISVEGSIDFPGEHNTKNNTEEFYITADAEAPVIINNGVNLRPENGRMYLDITVYDNHFIMAGQLYNAKYNGWSYYRGDACSTYPIPAFQTERGNGEYTYSFDITENLDMLKSGKAFFSVCDYAYNESSYSVSFEVAAPSDPTELKFTQDSMTLKNREVVFEMPLYTDSPDAVPESITWTSDNASIVKVVDGIVKAMAPGHATITVEKAYKTITLSDSIEINVTEEIAEETPAQRMDIYFNGENMNNGGYQIKTWEAPYAYMYKVGDTIKIDTVPYPWYASDKVNIVDTKTALSWGYDSTKGGKVWVVPSENIIELNNDTITFIRAGYMRILFTVNGNNNYYVDTYLGAVGTGEPKGPISVDDINIDINEPFTVLVNQIGDMTTADKIIVSGGDENIAKVYEDNVIVGMGEGKTTFDVIAQYTYNDETIELKTTVNVNVSANVRHKVMPNTIVLEFQDKTWGMDPYDDGPQFTLEVGTEYEIKYKPYPEYACDEVKVSNIPVNKMGMPVMEVLSIENGIFRFKFVDKCGFSRALESVHRWERYTIKELPNDTFMCNANAGLQFIVEDPNGLAPVPEEFVIVDGVLTQYNGSDLIITVPDGVTRIDDGVFSSIGYNIEQIILPYGIESIGASAFMGQRNLKSIELPYSLKTIEDNAFKYCGLESIVLPHSVETVLWNAFQGCRSLKYAELSSNLAWLQNYTFAGCTSLEEVKMYPGLTSIRYKAFESCPIKYLELPPTLKIIGEYAFRDSAIYGIDLQYIEEIHRDAFNNCRNLTSVEFGKNLQVIGEDAFAYCSLTELFLPKSIRRFDTSDTIRVGTFANNKLEKVVFEDGISIEQPYYRAIPYKMFYNNTNLKNITIADSILVIDDYAFYNCPMNGEIDWGGTKVIGNYAFYGNAIQGELTLPEGLEYVLRDAFICDGITSVNIPSTLNVVSFTPNKGSMVKDNVNINISPDNETWSVDNGALYMGTTFVRLLPTFVSDSTSIYEIREGTTRIETNAFINSVFDTIIVPASVKRVGEFAFGAGVKNVYFKNEVAPILEFYARLNAGYYAPRAVYNNFGAGTNVYFDVGAKAFDEYKWTSQNIVLGELNVKDIIDNLPEATIENEEAYINARKAYDMLSESGKANVTNYIKLVEGEKAILQLKYDAALSEIAKLNSEIESMKEAIAEVDSLKQTIDTLSQQISELEKNISDAEALIAELKAAKQELEQGYVKLADALKLMEEAKQAAEARERDALAKAEEANIAKAEAEAQIEIAKAKISELEEKTKNYEEIVKANEELNAKVNELIAKINELQAEINTLTLGKNEANAIIKELTDAKTELTAANEQLQLTITELENAKQAALNGEKDAKAQVETLNKEMEIAEAKLVAASEKIANLESQIDSYKQNIDALENNIASKSDTTFIMVIAILALIAVIAVVSIITVVAVKKRKA